MADEKKEGANAQASGNETKKVEEKVPEGVQKRIDELTAKNGELARQFAEQSARWEAEKADYDARLQGVQPLGPPPTMEQQIFQRLDQMEQMVHRMGQGFSYQQERQGLDFYSQQEKVPPEVLKKAQQLIDDEWRQGRQLNRKLAVTHAFGLVAEDDYRKRLAAQPQPQATGPLLFNTGDQAPVLNHAQTFQYPPDFKKWPLNKQSAWLKANYPDEPLRRTNN